MHNGEAQTAHIDVLASSWSVQCCFYRNKWFLVPSPIRDFIEVTSVFDKKEIQQLNQFLLA